MSAVLSINQIQSPLTGKKRADGCEPRSLDTARVDPRPNWHLPLSQRRLGGVRGVSHAAEALSVGSQHVAHSYATLIVALQSGMCIVRTVATDSAKGGANE